MRIQDIYMQNKDRIRHFNGRRTFFNLLLGLASVLPLASCRTEAAYRLTEEDNRVMKEEADAFLHNLPANLQHRQALAVRKAIGGDGNELDAVRHSRNTEPEISERVEVRMPTPTLRLYEPRGGSERRLPLLVYLHGGGWTFGSLNSCARFCNAVAESGEIKVLAVDYRLAPEHPFPAGLDDCRKAVRYAWENAALLGIDRNRISVGGDSSGGNLAIATALSEDEGEKIESLVLFYPVTKAYDDASRSWQQYGSGYGLDSELMCEFNRAYLAETHPHDGRVSVGLCDDETLSQLPRTLLIAAGRDILCDQGDELARRAGKRITRIEFPYAVHLFITVSGQERAFGKAVDFASAFILNYTSDR